MIAAEKLKTKCFHMKIKYQYFAAPQMYATKDLEFFTKEMWLPNSPQNCLLIAELANGWWILKRYGKGFMPQAQKKIEPTFQKHSMFFFMSLLANIWLPCCDWCPLSSYTLSHCHSGYRPKLSTVPIIRKENNVTKRCTPKSSLEDVENM